MHYRVFILGFLVPAFIHLTSGLENHSHSHSHSHGPSQFYANDTIPFSTRAFWMRRANEALRELDSPCPFAAFGTVIVNHTDLSEGPHGKAICYGVNSNSKTGNPTLHGEVAGINNCSAMLTDPEGEYRLTGAEAFLAFATLSLYTNAEPCPMCASAIRWSGFSECIFGTSIATLIAKGWLQIEIAAEEVFDRSEDLPSSTKLYQEVLTNETDPYFFWQYDKTYPCPKGCERTSSGGSCAVVVEKHEL